MKENPQFGDFPGKNAPYWQCQKYHIAMLNLECHNIVMVLDQPMPI
jgi:hypothetical protein